jgi:AraC family transcriptional regulator
MPSDSRSIRAAFEGGQHGCKFAMSLNTQQLSSTGLNTELSAARMAGFEAWPQSMRHDVMRHLVAALGPALRRPDPASVAFVDHVAAALRTYLAKSRLETHSAPSSRPGGLPVWKERRVTELMRQEIANKLSLERLATECDLSVRHFTRAFRLSTGVSPHRYLLGLRLEKARQLLADPAVPLQEVAMSCGFADQSHFTRVFSAVEQVSPGMWRRSHVASDYA